MALVWRGAVMGGQQAGQVVAAAVGHAPVSAAGHAPVGVPGQATPQSGGPAGVAVAVGPMGLGDAAAVPSLPASPFAVLGSFALMGAGTFGAWAINTMPEPPATFRMAAGMSAWGGIVVFSAAVERLMEPISQWLPGRRSKGEYEGMVAAVANRHPAMGLADVAHAKARMDRARSNRGVLVWGLATAVATVVASAAGFNLMHMVAETDQWNGVANWVDSLVTGLVVGSGTKPLHDVISRVQKSKERADDAT